MLNNEIYNIMRVRIKKNTSVLSNGTTKTALINNVTPNIGIKGQESSNGINDMQSIDIEQIKQCGYGDSYDDVVS